MIVVISCRLLGDTLELSRGFAPRSQSTRNKESVTSQGAVEPAFRHETIFGRRRNHPETKRRLWTLEISKCGLGLRTSFMVELAALVIGLFSVGIFAAHAFDAFHAQ
jgi:hypothetical protein